MLAKIAEEMTRKFECKVKEEQVTKIKEEGENIVYAAVCGNVTILCWMHISGTCKVKYI